MTTARKSFFSRRNFIKGLGAGAGLLPLLEASRSQAAAYPRRLIVVLGTEGVIGDSYFPKGNGTDLSALTFPDILKPLEPYKADINVLGDVEAKNFTDYTGHGGGHENYSLIFTGAKGVPSSYKDPRWEVWEAGSPTFDRAIIDGLAKTAPTALPVIRQGVQIERQGSYTAQRRCFWRGAGQPESPEDSPTKVFNNVFAGRQLGNTTELDRIRAERKSLLDFMGRDIAAYGKRLGSEDRIKIDAHLQGIRDVERQLEAGQMTGGAACNAMMPAALDLNANASYPKIMAAQFDLAVAALSCDVTRVVTIQLGNANGEKIMFDWLGIDPKGQEYANRDHHDIAHRPGTDSRDKIRVDQWFHEQLAGLLKRLKAVPEGNGSLLDNTAVLWANHMGNGGAHSSNNLPWILAGRCGGYFKTGRYVKGIGTTNAVMTALGNAMGVPMASFGDSKYGGEAVALRG